MLEYSALKAYAEIEGLDVDKMTAIEKEEAEQAFVGEFVTNDLFAEHVAKNVYYLEPEVVASLTLTRFAWELLEGHGDSRYDMRTVEGKNYYFTVL